MAELQCPSCRKRLRMPDSIAGKGVRCSGCKSVVRAPSKSSGPARTASKPAAERIATRCQHCRVTLRLPSRAVDKQVRCPKCQQKFTAKAMKPGTAAARRPEPVGAAAADGPIASSPPLDDFPLTDADLSLSQPTGALPIPAQLPPKAAGGRTATGTSSSRAIYALPATLTVIFGSINLLGFLGLAVLSLALSLMTFNLLGLVATVLIGASAVTTGANTVLGGVNVLRMVDRRHGIWAGRMLVLAPIFALAFCAWRINLILGVIVFVAVLIYSWPIGFWMMFLLDRKKAVGDFGELSDDELMTKYL